jgi:hypothetical protein
MGKDGLFCLFQLFLNQNLILLQLLLTVLYMLYAIFMAQKHITSAIVLQLQVNRIMGI